MDYYAHPLFEKLMKDEENNICNDCRIGHPNWASVNNGVFLCLNCAGIHRGFGVLVSNIRSLTMDNWDENQINFLLKGGNLRFKAFMKEYNVPSNAGPDFKYLISATNYYRKLLRAEITHETLPEKPDSISGLELLDLGNNYYTNIDNSAPITNQAVIKNEFNPVKKQGFFGKIGGFLGNVKESVSEKIKEAKLGEKLKETSEKALVVAKKTGNFVVKKGKEAYTSTFVQNIANKTEEGLNTIVNKAKKIFRNDEEGHNKSLNSSNYHSLDNDHSLLNQNENSNFSVNYISENKNISTNQSNLNQN